MSDVQTARSYRSSLVDDNMVVSLNIKWMVQLCVLVGAIVYGYYNIMSRLTILEAELVETDSQIRSLFDKHSVEEERKRSELESRVSFYEEKMNINVNPLSWKLFNKENR
jgi:hypothetical protein